jgi:hypothetical protein
MSTDAVLARWVIRIPQSERDAMDECAVTALQQLMTA